MQKILKMKFSKKDVIRAGKRLVDDNLLNDQEALHHTMSILTYWRDSHLLPLEKSNRLLNQYIHHIDKEAFIAKRIKRFESIKRKLKRFESMELKNMQDIGGIRIVLSSQKQVNSMLKILTNEPSFNKNGSLIKLDNYIKNPKFDGYRSIHLIGVFQNEDLDDRKIEFQLRTKLQHSWATTLEIIDIFTQQNLKSDNGFQAYKDFFKNVSDLFQIIENFKSFTKNNMELIQKDLLDYLEKNEDAYKKGYEIVGFLGRRIDQGSTIKDQLKVYCSSLKELNTELNTTDKKSFILIRLNTKTGKVENEKFSKKESKNALEIYSFYEQTLSKNPDIIVALLSTDAIGGLQEAYPNYFADSETFLNYIHIIEMSVKMRLIKEKLANLLHTKRKSEETN